MARPEEAAAWHNAVYQVVQTIPYGRVTSYAHIARMLGRPECPRQVGMSLKRLPDSSGNVPFHNDNVPWQRVINSKGQISPRGVGGARRQATALEAEGLNVGQTSMGEFTIDFAVYGWFPEVESDSDSGKEG